MSRLCLTPQALEREKGVVAKLEVLESEFKTAIQAAEESRIKSAADATQAQDALTVVGSEVSGLKAGLGLAGMTEPLAKRDELLQLEKR